MTILVSKVAPTSCRRILDYGTMFYIMHCFGHPHLWYADECMWASVSEQIRLWMSRGTAQTQSGMNEVRGCMREGSVWLVLVDAANLITPETSMGALSRGTLNRQESAEGCMYSAGVERKSDHMHAYSSAEHVRGGPECAGGKDERDLAWWAYQSQRHQSEERKGKEERSLRGKEEPRGACMLIPLHSLDSSSATFTSAHAHLPSCMRFLCASSSPGDSCARTR